MSLVVHQMIWRDGSSAPDHKIVLLLDMRLGIQISQVPSDPSLYEKSVNGIVL